MQHVRIGEDVSLEDLAFMELSALGARKGLKKLRKFHPLAIHRRVSPARRLFRRKERRPGAPPTEAATPSAPYAAPPAAPAPEEMAPEEMAPEEMAPEEMAPEEMAPEEMAPEEMAPEEMAPEEMAPEEMAPAAPEEAAPEEAATKEMAPKEATSLPISKEKFQPEIPVPAVAPMEIDKGIDKEKNGESGAPSKFPWVPVLIGAGAIIVGLVVYFLFIRKSAEEPRI